MRREYPAFGMTTLILVGLLLFVLAARARATFVAVSFSQFTTTASVEKTWVRREGKNDGVATVTLLSTGLQHAASSEGAGHGTEEAGRPGHERRGQGG